MKTCIRLFSSRQTLNHTLSLHLLNRGLRSYFYSGWSFLIPYLLLYLLYAYTEWPTSGTAKPSSKLPSLLELYWILHGLHLFLGMVALTSWCRALKCTAITKEVNFPISISALGHRAADAIPWLLLAAVFYIPGLYLEFPSDPWHHFLHVNEWTQLTAVTSHSLWQRWSYFLAHSFIVLFDPDATARLSRFQLYYVCTSLLLCWQLYRLGRSLHLRHQWSFVFVLLFVLLSGNSAFSYFRYYGMSSALIAQCGLVALIRIVIRTFDLRQGSHTGNQPGPPFAPGLNLSTIILLPALLLLIGFSHIQGIAMAGICITAVLTWRLLKYRIRVVLCAFAIVILVSATVAWLPRHPYIDQLYRPAGWIAPYYGFAIFDVCSPAFERSADVIGLFGLVNVLCALILIRRNHVVGWLTVMPFIVLSVPASSIPLASMLARTSELEEGYIIAFNRLLLAIPTGLAVSFVARAACLYISHSNSVLIRHTWFVLPAAILGIFTAMPATDLIRNRLFNLVIRPANDLQMQHVLEKIPPLAPLPQKGGSLAAQAVTLGGVVTTPGIAYVHNVQGYKIANARQWMTWPTLLSPASAAEELRRNLVHVDRNPLRWPFFAPQSELYSPHSQLGYISKHWLPNIVAIEHSTQREIAQLAKRPSGVARPPQLWLEWIAPDNSRHFGRGAATNLDQIASERGEINDDLLYRTGDTAILTPVLRTIDGNAIKVVIEIQGPDQFRFRKELRMLPNPTGGDRWLYADFPITLKQSGTYNMKLTGMTAWPDATHVVTYVLTLPHR